MGNGFSKEELKGYAGGKRAEFEKILSEIVEIPTVSVEPDRKGEVRRGAEYAASLLKSWGAEVEVFDTKGHPIVHGKFTAGPNFRPSPFTTTSTCSRPTDRTGKPSPSASREKATATTGAARPTTRAPP